jgi:glutamyl/glutaminyl-tRNA synthetase
MPRVRFAPSPTGSLHVGNALVAVANRRVGESMLLNDGDGRAVVREFKAVGGDLKATRVALTGRDRGPELATVIDALPREEALRRIDAAL